MERVIGFVKPGSDCVICKRPKVALQGIEHNGWCWWCVKNKMEGRGYDSYGKPFEASTSS